LRYRNEEDRSAALLAELRLQNIDVRALAVAGAESGHDFGLRSRDVMMSDVSEAVCALRALNRWETVKQVFPTFGGRSKV
jgi:hypothetical protein